MKTDDVYDRAVLLARLLRTVDRIVHDSKQMERDRRELQRLVQQQPAAEVTR